MSATEQAVPGQQAEASACSSIFHPGLGDKLTRARVALGLGISDVAAKLKLSERQIEAMEAEDFAQLPGEVFSRGFVRNYARLLKLDPEQLIIPVDIHAAVAETITAPSEGVIFASPGLRRWVLLPLLVLGFFVLLVALIYYWLRQGEETLVNETPASAAVVSQPLPPLYPIPVNPLSPPATLTPDATAPVDAAPTAPVPMTPNMPSPVAPPLVTPLPATPQAAIPAPVAPTPVVAPAGKGRTLRFAPSLDAWIQVVDGEGKRYSKLVRAGSVELFSGLPPFKLVVGEAAQVQLTYDGHRIDLTPFIGQKVARLTLE
jgi:cytoskeleton protein RodZ